MTDERRRVRRHELADAPTEELDLDRLRYFTQPGEGKPMTRHRRRRAMPEVIEPAEAAGTPVEPAAPMPPAPAPSAPPSSAPPAPTPAPDQPLRLSSGEYSDPLRTAVPHRQRKRPAPAPRAAAARTAATPTAATPTAAAPAAASATGSMPAASRPAPTEPPVEAPDAAGGGGRRRTHFLDDDRDAPDRRRRPRRTSNKASRAARHTRRRVVLAVVGVCLVAMVAAVGLFGLRSMGVFENNKDYDNAAGTSDVIVDIPQDSTLMDFGRILEDNDVVGSVNAFVKAADGQPMSGGFYKLRTQIPAATAVEMMTDGNAHRVGRMVVPEGLQLDNKTGIDDKITPGIFQMISDATSITVNGQQTGASVEALEKAAAEDSPEALGVPEWARPTVTELTGDHRRIEGLIAPGTWETIDPQDSPTKILHDLIVASTNRFEQWGLLGQTSSGLTPYQTLVAASVVEREVASADDYAKVARVILNRLAKDQRLEMDSTANYTAAVTNIDVHGDSYKADNKWNTYRNQGLPITPIGAVGQRALAATENPTSGRWLYFVTIDREGTTLFADTFEQHVRNREKACQNALLSTGCS
ncbi:endolytic transglycosylase MltG [Gordonia sp. CPCC 206044]|uniref:endolytic transglycosylase MltG n=1 Tax=Gordonia sp. CPCC 206044 TaxID=3140793 RepID=UPI003AF3CCEF